MNRTWLAVIAGTAAALGIGYGANRYLKAKRENTADESGTCVDDAKGKHESTKIAKFDCVKCGKPVSEYEPFCPYCGYTIEPEEATATAD